MYIVNVDIETTDLSKSKVFYTEVLEFELLEESSAFFSVQAGETILTLKAVSTPVEIYHLAFNIPSSQLNESLKWAEGKLDLIKNVEGNLVSTFEEWKAQSIYFRDNDGNILEFIAREDIQLSIDGPFNPAQITCISEIGLVVENPIKQAEKLIAEYDLSYFDKAKPTESFLALGDDQGLLIMVSPNRNWYPTSIPAKYSNLSAIIESNEMMISIDSQELK